MYSDRIVKHQCVTPIKQADIGPRLFGNNELSYVVEYAQLPLPYCSYVSDRLRSFTDYMADRHVSTYYAGIILGIIG